MSAETTPEWLALTVRDNGIGIPPDEQARIFEAFQRLHTEEEFPGTGLGLAIVQKIMLRLGGTTSVQSTPGQGTAITLSLPMTPPANAVDATEDSDTLNDAPATAA